MLRFTLQDVNSKKLILRKATTLRNLEEGDEFYKVYIKPDLTPLQVEESKNLVNELKKVRERDQTKKWKIYKGRITEVDALGNVITQR